MTAAEAVARARVAEELPAARAWASRNGLDLEWEPEGLHLALNLEGPSADGQDDPEVYRLVGTALEYKAMPPRWLFVHPETEAEIGPAAFPQPGPDNPRQSPLLLRSNPEQVVICAPFNRLAFAEEAGPHGDWGGPANWQEAGTSDNLSAKTIAEMLMAIHLDVRTSLGRMEPLP